MYACASVQRRLRCDGAWTERSPGRGAPRTRARLALVRRTEAVRPRMGALLPRMCVSLFKARVRARFRARARRYEVCDVQIRWVQVATSHLKYYFKWRASCIEDVRDLARVRGMFPYRRECYAQAPSVRSRAKRKCVRCLYGFMRCKMECVSTLACSRYLEVYYNNCPVSWRKPVGRAVVRTQDSCLMVRKDTNSKVK